jgi:hypothetical protein
MNDVSSPSWSLPKRIGFRFLFSFLLLAILEPFGLFGQLTGLSRIGGQWERLVKWFGQQVFQVKITVLPNGSGDTTFNYVELACWVGLSVGITVLWTLLDRKRAAYVYLNELLRLVVRGYLALTLLSYGINKLVPIQFGSLRLAEMLQPIGEQSPMGLLWRFMAASPAYTMFTGFAEVLSACLLLFRRTTMLGALICAGVMAHVVVLNFCYDVPVKLFSSRLFLLSLLLLAPDLKRLWHFFILHQPVEAQIFPPHFKSRGANTAALVSKVVVLVLYVTMVILNTTPMWLPKLTGAPKAPLHGIWLVDEFKREAQVLPPLSTDKQRWNHLIIEGVQFPGSDASIIGVITPMAELSKARWQQCKIDETKHTLTLTAFDKKKDPPPSAVLTFARPKPDQLVLTGTSDGKLVEVKLHRIPDTKFPLISRGFHWINEYPFSR